MEIEILHMVQCVLHIQGRCLVSAVQMGRVPNRGSYVQMIVDLNILYMQ